MGLQLCIYTGVKTVNVAGPTRRHTHTNADTHTYSAVGNPQGFLGIAEVLGIQMSKVPSGRLHCVCTQGHTADWLQRFLAL